MNNKYESHYYFSNITNITNDEILETIFLFGPFHVLVHSMCSRDAMKLGIYIYAESRESLDILEILTQEFKRV